MECSKPFIKNGQKFRCYQCYPCRLHRMAAWVPRLLIEDDQAQYSYFLTLTIANENLRFRNQSNAATLCKRDLQLYIKRLRRTMGIPCIKYAACGEYGGKSRRPHYHLLLFIPKSELKRSYVEHSIEKQWQFGQIHFGDVTPASISYVTGYIISGNSTARKSDNRTINEKEFLLFSKGLGSAYLTSSRQQQHFDELTENLSIFIRGKRYPLHKYFKDRIYDQRSWETIKTAYAALTEVKDKKYYSKQLDDRKNSQSYSSQKLSHHKKLKYAI